MPGVLMELEMRSVDPGDMKSVIVDEMSILWSAIRSSAEQNGSSAQSVSTEDPKHGGGGGGGQRGLIQSGDTGSVLLTTDVHHSLCVKVISFHPLWRPSPVNTQRRDRVSQSRRSRSHADVEFI